MFLPAPSFRLFLFAFCLLIFDFCCAHPTPYSHTSTVFPRQETQLTLPATVTQTQRIATGVGTFIQTCTITLTPIVVNGANMVREEKSCVLTPDNGNSSAPGALPPPASSPTLSTDLPSPTDVPSGTTDIPSSPTDIPSNTVPPDPTGTNLPPDSAPVPPPIVSVTLTTVPLPDVSNPVLPPPSGTNNTVPSSNVPVIVIGLSSAPNPVPTPDPDSIGTSTDTPPLSSPLALPLSSGPSSSSPHPTPSAENAGAAATFDPPGKKLEVLPIGLGVFAGISGIAIIVVGVVTWERRKHRKNFRKLKLQEAGTRMGYGAA